MATPSTVKLRRKTVHRYRPFAASAAFSSSGRVRIPQIVQFAPHLSRVMAPRSSQVQKPEPEIGQSDNNAPPVDVSEREFSDRTGSSRSSNLAAPSLWRRTNTLSVHSAGPLRLTGHPANASIPRSDVGTIAYRSIPRTQAGAESVQLSKPSSNIIYAPPAAPTIGSPKVKLPKAHAKYKSGFATATIASGIQSESRPGVSNAAASFATHASTAASFNAYAPVAIAPSKPFAKNPDGSMEVRPEQDPASPGSSATNTALTVGTIFLDGSQLGEWVTRHLEGLLTHAPIGSTGADPRFATPWFGST